MGAVKGRTQVADMSQHSFGRVPCVIVLKGYAVVTFLCFFLLCEQRKKGISLLLSCCETRKLKKGSFKETCFFGSASITKQKMNNKLLTNQSKKCYNLNKARQAVK